MAKEQLGRFGTTMILAVMIVLTTLVVLKPRDKNKDGDPAAEKAAVAAATMQDAFATVAQKCSPAVVVIRTGQSRDNNNYHDASTSIYEYFHGNEESNKKAAPNGLGSGFFIRPEGYILTNYHLVKRHDVFTVTLQNRSKYPARLVGVDPLSDLAVLKIEGDRPFPFLEFADSEKVKVGHWAIAIGAPLSLNHSVTVGVVSHNRRAMGLNVYENFIQTDAAINMGNSGGPLLDISGRVIGVNDLILSPSSGNIGLSFAIAGNLARQIGDELIIGGKIVRPWLGIAMRPVSNSASDGSSSASGVVVMDIFRDGPAARNGVQQGDILSAIDNRKITALGDVQRIIAGHRPGDKVKLSLSRQGKPLEMVITVEKIPEK